MKIIRVLSRMLSALPKVTLHPLFLAYLAVLFFSGRGDSVVLGIGVVLLHEVGHFASAKIVGAKLSNVTMYPYGAVMENEGDFPPNTEWKVAIAGPITNLAFAVLGGVALIFAKNPFWASFVNANLTVALFNLIPVYPLDGGRVLLALSKKRIKTVKRLRIAGVGVALALFAVFVFSITKGLNLSIGVMSVFLMVGAVTGVEKEMSAQVASVLLSDKKRYSEVLPVVGVVCSPSTPVHKVLSQLSPKKLTEISIREESGEIKTVSEEEFLRFAKISKARSTIGEMFDKKY